MFKCRSTFFLLSSWLLVSCSMNAQISPLDSTLTNDIQGSIKVVFSGLNKIESQSSHCAEFQATLHSFNSDGTIDPAVKLSSAVDSAGGFKFQSVRTAGVSLEELEPKFLIKVTGCGLSYSRPVTGYQNQDITKGSTLLVLSSEVQNRKSLATVSKTEVESLISLLDSQNATDITVTFRS